jgi:hypothetical protein
MRSILENIQKFMRDNQFILTGHARVRMFENNISTDTIIIPKNQSTMLTGLTILLVTAPEALLITRAQIFQANKLYQKIEKGELALTIPPRVHLLDYKTRFIAYLDSLPPERETKNN